MDEDLEQLEQAISSLEAQRSTLGDAVVDLALGAMQQRLNTLRAQAPTRRQISVLFLDIVNSSSLSRQLDPEDIHKIFDGMLSRCTSIVLQYGGRAIQYAGDSLMAGFGTEQANEGDAEQAVHCGLALLSEGEKLAQQMEKDYNFKGSGVRVGIHTGPVLLGSGADAVTTIRGATVNLAARMEQSAPIGKLRISQDTWLLVRGTFEFSSQPPMQVKGYDQPIHSWLVTKPLRQKFLLAGRGVTGLSTPLFGREAELEQLINLINDTATSGTQNILTIIANPGLGKSRLLQEFTQYLKFKNLKTTLLQGRAHPQSQMQPYGLLRNIVLSLSGVADSDSGNIAKQKIVSTLSPLLTTTGESGSHWIGQLIGLPFSGSPHLRGVDARQLRDSAFNALREVFQGLADQHKTSVLVILLEDLHWADDGSLDFLETIESSDNNPPMLVLMTSRPEILERRPECVEVQSRQPLTLSALSARESRHLAEALLSKMESDAEQIQDLLIDRAEGNPYYMEELVNMLLDQGAIRVEHREGEDIWHSVADKLQTSHLPSSLIEVLQARLHALNTDDRRALQLASVIGHVFWDDALQTLDPEATAAVPSLRRKELVLQHPTSTFSRTTEEAFQHHLLHEVTYNTVLNSIKQQGHAQTAMWLAQRVGDRTAEYLAITADHFYRAGDFNRAVDFFEQAAQNAKQSFANNEVLHYADRALQIDKFKDPQRRSALLRLQEEAADYAGLWERTQQAIDDRSDIAEATDNDALRASVMLSRARQSSRLGKEQDALQYAQQALAVAEHCNAANTAALACGQIGHSLYLSGQMDAVRPLIETGLKWISQALQQDDSEGNRISELQLYNYLAIAEIGTMRLSSALLAAENALRRAKTQGVQRMIAATLNTIAGVEMALGRADKAIPRLEEAVTLAAQHNWLLVESFARHNIGVSQRMAGRFHLAHDSNDLAADIAERIQLGQHHARCLMMRGIIFFDQKKLQKALEAYDQALDIFKSLNDEPYCCQVQARIAIVQLELGQLPSAQSNIDTVAKAFSEGISLDGTEEPLYASLACVRVWDAVNDSRALSRIKLTYQELQRQIALIENEQDRQCILTTVTPYPEIIAVWEKLIAK